MEINEVLEKVKVEEFNPNSKYLIVLTTNDRLTGEEIERSRDRLVNSLTEILEDIPYQIVIVGDAHLDVFEIKSKKV